MLCVSVVLLETVNVTCWPTFTDLDAGKNASAAMPFLSLPALTVSPLGTPWPATSFLASLDAALACFLIACLSCFFVVMCAFLAFTTTVPFMPGCSAQNTVYVPCLVNFTLNGFGGPPGSPEPTRFEPTNVWPPAGAAASGLMPTLGLPLNQKSAPAASLTPATGLLGSGRNRPGALPLGASVTVWKPRILKATLSPLWTTVRFG